jgi:apolipoprotein N-acyltransferase
MIIPGSSKKQAFWYGWLTGTVYFLGCIYWVTHTMVVYGGLPLSISFLLMLLLVIYLGIYVGLFSYFFKRMSETVSPLLQLLAAPSLWVALEWLRGHLLSGFPWALLGYSQYRVLPVIQISDLTGVYGVSFLLVATNVAITHALKGMIERKVSRQHLQKVWSPLLVSGILIGLNLVYGFLRLSELSGQPATGSLKVGLIQGNIHQEQKWDPAYRRETVEIYKHLTQQAILTASRQQDYLLDSMKTSSHGPAAASLDLVVWPETATPFFFEYEQPYRDELKAFLQEQKAPLLFGSPSLGPGPIRTVSGPMVFNSAYLLSSDGIPLARYDKIHLVPFGEYVPLSSILFFVRKLVEDIGELGGGTEYTIMKIPQGRFGVVICFEVIFPELVRQFARAGTDFMATLTNDAWYGWSSAPYQHFSMVVFRSVENRVPFIRAANTGITGSIDATGRILGTTELFVKTYLVQDIPLKKVKSLYTQYGDLFAYLCGIIALATLIYALGQGRNPARRSGRQKQGAGEKKHA